MREQNLSELPNGYTLDLISDPDVIVLHREDESIVARFLPSVDPMEIRRVAEEDQREREE